MKICSKQILLFAMKAGRIVLQNGASTNRAEDTINRILNKHDFKISESFVSTTGIFMSIVDNSGEILTLVNRIQNRTININKIVIVNDISRKYVSNEITFDEANRLIDEIDLITDYSSFIKAISWGVVSVGFAYAISKDLYSSLISFFVCFASYYVYEFLGKKKFSNFFNILTTSLFYSVVTLMLSQFIPVDYNTIIIGCIMPIVPGVALVNAFRDVFAGDYLAATGRFLDCLITTAAIAVGVAFALNIYSYFYSL